MLELAPLVVLATVALILSVARLVWGRFNPKFNQLTLLILLSGLGCAIPYLLWVAHAQAPPGQFIETAWLPYIGWAIVAFLVYGLLLVWQRRNAG